MITKLVSLINAIVNVDQKMGFKRFVKYFLIGVILFFIFNYKAVIKDCIELVAEISTSIHDEKMLLRDQLLSELGPILTDFRSNVKADRILYFEYHNSKENLVGIPFKYLELVRQHQSYSIPPARESEYKNINTGAITSLYEDIKLGSIAYCKGPGDQKFHAKYPGVFDVFNLRDGANSYVFISIPGINTPIGMIVLEWLNENPALDNAEIMNEINHVSSHNYIPRINALILSKKR